MKYFEHNLIGIIKFYNKRRNASPSQAIGKPKLSYRYGTLAVKWPLSLVMVKLREWDS